MDTEPAEDVAPVTELSLRPTTTFQGPPEVSIIEFVSVRLVNPVPSGLTTVHRMDPLGIWCSDDDFHPKQVIGAEHDFIFRLSLLPWANIKEVAFIAAT